MSAATYPVPTAYPRGSSKASGQPGLHGKTPQAGHLKGDVRKRTRCSPLYLLHTLYETAEMSGQGKSQDSCIKNTRTLHVAYALMTTVPLGPPTLWPDIN